MENLSGVVLLYKISENLFESKRFKTSRELLAILALCMFMYLLNLHTTPKGHLIKIGTFLQK